MGRGTPEKTAYYKMLAEVLPTLSDEELLAYTREGAPGQG